MEIINVGNRFVNSYLYPVREGYVLIDTGDEHSWKSFLKRLKKNGISPEDISYIFLTHSHYDHAGLLPQLLRANPKMKVILHPDGAKWLRQGKTSSQGRYTSILSVVFCKIMEVFKKGEHHFPPITRELEDRLILLSLENQQGLEEILEGQIIRTPGHTSDSISLFCKEKFLFCGDAAMNGFPSQHHISILMENKKKYIASWKKIIQLQPGQILPGHGKVFSYQSLRKDFVDLEKLDLSGTKK